MRTSYFLIILVLLVFSIQSQAASHHPQDFLNKISGRPDEGAQIVRHFCAHCHARRPVIPIGAPRMGVRADWNLRIKQGLDVLFKHTEEGLNAMPPRGGCFECSDEQLMLAVKSLLPTSREDHK